MEFYKILLCCLKNWTRMHHIRVLHERYGWTVLQEPLYVGLMHLYKTPQNPTHLCQGILRGVLLSEWILPTTSFILQLLSSTKKSTSEGQGNLEISIRCSMRGWRAKGRGNQQKSLLLVWLPFHMHHSKPLITVVHCSRIRNLWEPHKGCQRAAILLAV